MLRRPVLVLTGLAAACAVRRAPAGLPAPPCLAREDAATTAEWVLHTDADERAVLDAWCWAVGPALHETAPGSEARSIDALTVVVWNAATGGGDLAALVRDLRNGVLTGSPVQDFVLLLQEVHRSGEPVPAAIPEWSATSRRIGAPSETRVDVRAFAQRENLSLVYAPSMRNGSAGDPGPPEDRGNAILSTIPLHDPAFVELPFERQRRVAVVANVHATSSAHEPWMLRFVSVHFDNRARFGRILRSFGAAHLRQAQWLADVLDDGTHTVLGGDLNTWNGGAGAEAVQLLRAHFPLPAEHPAQATLPLPSLLPDLRLDHLFFRVPEGWSAEYRIVDDAYGSDHRPLVGTVRISG